MKPITENEFEIREAKAVPMSPSRFSQARNYLTVLKQLFQARYNFDLLPPRLRRDAGIDELEVERRKVARAPLIR